MISQSYVLFSRIELIKTRSGKLYTGQLWAKDLLLHLDYLSDFKLCCPIIYSDDIQGLIDITDYPISNVFPLEKDKGLLSVVKNLIPNFMSVIKAVRQASIVHSGGAGWAFPLSFYIFFLRPFFSFKWVILIESSFWMLSEDEPASLRMRIEHSLYKMILTHSLKSAEARIFTQSFYRKYFLKEDTDRTLIAPASWVDDEYILSEETMRACSKPRRNNVLNMLYPARLERNKGVNILFEAIEYLKIKDVTVNITIMGAGSLKSACETFSQRDFGNLKVNFLEQVTYGKEFYDVIANFDIVLVPNIKEEQPRIIFDSFSQCVGVIASNTSGILDITIDGVNAVICKKGDPQSLAEAIIFVVENPELSQKMGVEGLKYVQNRTHVQMHKCRHDFLEKVL